MNEQQARQKLEAIGQQHLLKYWDTLSHDDQKTLLAQIDALDIHTLEFQQSLLRNPLTLPAAIEPLTDFSHSNQITDTNTAKKMIAEGQLGCLIVAGGQGSRLRFNGPKGIFPVTPVKHKSLFQLFAEKTVAAGKQAGRALPLAIMTSPANHVETITFFKEHSFFGLNPTQLSIFPQEMLPLLDPNGSLFLENKHIIAEGPDGNGAALHHFYNHKIWKKWHNNGVRYLNFILIDNALCDPYDAKLLGYLNERECDLAIKCVERQNPEEKVGILAKQDGKAVVIEYSEMPEAQRKARTTNGALVYPCANLSLYCFRMDFIKKIANLPIEQLSLHLAFKTAKALETDGKPIQNKAWKFEKFIFDILPFAHKASALLYPRNDCFAPLKNFYGVDSIDTVKAALQENDRKIFSQITGHPCTNTPFELSQAFHYPTTELLAKWRNRSGPYENYIEA
jgi:UDP-N-acetylglucosamine/UDP-N-acetylgalactosamine diphosphorylase